MKFWTHTTYQNVIQNYKNVGRLFTQSPDSLGMNFSQNNAKYTYFNPKMYWKGRKMYLVDNVLENQIWAVPLLIYFKEHRAKFR